MRKTFSTIFIIFLSLNLAYCQESKCSRKASFGSAKICLPKIKGYQECYEDPTVKQLADATEVQMNLVLGFYLNDETYNRRDSLGLITFDDYFKIYGTKQIQDYEADKEVLGEMKDMLKGSFVSKNWDLMKKELDEIDLEVEIGTPTVINSYELNDASFSLVMLTTYKQEGADTITLAMTVNGFLCNNRLVWMAYYLNYEGEETIDKLEEKSNLILEKLMAT